MPNVTTPVTAAVVAAPQDSGSSGAISATTAAILAAAGPIIAANSPVGQGATNGSSPASGSNTTSSTGTNGPAPSGLTGSANPSPSVATSVQASTSPGSSVNTIDPLGSPNVASLVPIASNTASASGAATDPIPNVATAQQLNSAVGATANVPANPGAAGAFLAPTPLSLTDPLPPTQAGVILTSVPDAGAIGGGAGSGVVPESLPEPGSLALFAAVILASAMKVAIRRLRGRGQTTPAHVRDLV